MEIQDSYSHEARPAWPLSFATRSRLGVQARDGGLLAAVYAPHAEAVEIVLYTQDSEETYRLHPSDEGIWHGGIAGFSAGTAYHLRADGKYSPERGLFYDPTTLLLDPWARAIEALPAPTTAKPVAPRGIVVSEDFDWGHSRRPGTGWNETVIYEAHVKGLTRLAEFLPEELRGTYAGLAHPSVIDHLHGLGVSTVELLPIYASFPEDHLRAQGLGNYWGYSALSFFSPHPLYATRAAQAAGPQSVIAEVKGMIKLLHEAGIEVVLDVVYNHTCEGSPRSPVLSWRGIDNLAYYRTNPEDPGQYVDYTGCGNTLDFGNAAVVGMALDSLRHWARDYQIDGFRYDLAVTLGRGERDFDPEHPFWTALRTDPELKGLKHIVEPWDLGPHGWHTGDFPPPIAAWNDSFRDDARMFWLRGPAERAAGNPGTGIGHLATRLSGSQDIFGASDPLWHRGPRSSVNFVAAHDGFTLADLVCYDHKHNHDNGENNADGTENNLSWNHGSEGFVGSNETMDGILQLRLRSIRNLLATLAFSAGTPMLSAGDEMGRTQRGNNNAYCQDNAISWINWELQDWNEHLLDTVRYLFALRRDHPVLRSREFFTGKPHAEGLAPDVAWFEAEGLPADQEHWRDPASGSLMMVRGRPNADARDALVMINGTLDPIEFTAPEGIGNFELAWNSAWECPEDTGANEDEQLYSVLVPAQRTTLEALSLRLYLSR